MDHAKLIASLERLRRVLPLLVGDLSEEDCRWKPANGAWSILEIVRHLGDEEQLDFHRRVAATLQDPQQTWPPIDPEGWAVERRYNEGDLSETVQAFCQRRAESLAFLRSLDSPDWDQAYDHPQIGPLRAGDLLTAWVAHDTLHLRQIAKRLYELAERDGAPYSARYAGGW